MLEKVKRSFSNVVELQIENFQLSYPSIMYGGNWCSKETTKETLIGQGRNKKQSNPNMYLKICLDCWGCILWWIVYNVHDKYLPYNKHLFWGLFLGKCYLNIFGLCSLSFWYLFRIKVSVWFCGLGLYRMDIDVSYWGCGRQELNSLRKHITWDREKLARWIELVMNIQIVKSWMLKGQP